MSRTSFSTGPRLARALLAASVLLAGLMHVPGPSASAQTVEPHATEATAAPRKLAFTAGGVGNTSTEIYTVFEDGTGLTRLTNNGHDDRFPTWSPDGTEIAFESNRNHGTWNIFRMKADGSGQTAVTNSEQASNFDPAWSPDAQKFAFVSNRGGPWRAEIWVIGADGSNPQRLTVNVEHKLGTINPVFTQDFEPAWSPDGTKIAFSSNRDDLQNRDIYVMNADGSNVTRLTEAAGDERDPTWSPDGTKIAFTSLRDGNHEIYVMNADGSGETNLTSFASANDFQPAWSPDGSTIVFARLGGGHDVMTLYRMNTDGTAQQPLIPGNTLESWTPAWQTTGGPVAPDPPTAPGYRLSGRVISRNINPSGIGVAGVRVELSGSHSAVTHTDAEGNYAFDNIPANGAFTVAPKGGNYWYYPSSQSFTTGSMVDSFGNGKRTANFDANSIFIGFTSSSDYFASESAGTAYISVSRSAVVGTSTVDYNVGGGTATPGVDYVAASGTVHFADGETSKWILVTILDDKVHEDAETVQITLSNSTGGFLGISQVTLNINDNDPVNPIDDTEFFVRQHYADFLNREPEAAGLQFWMNQIESCGTNAQCREIRRINVSAAFFLSIEFQETGYLVYRFYKAAYGDATSPGVAGTVPVIRREEFLPDTQKIGEGVRVGIGDWAAKLEANKQAYALEFVGRQRFKDAFPVNMTPEQFVDQLIARAGLTVSQSERDALVAQLAANNTDEGRAAVLRAVAENEELRRAEFNRAFVLMQYYGYLRRNPDDAPDTNFGGWKFWLDKLNEFNGNFVDAQMVKAFLDSIEYRRRFAP